jgi:hypothetical protein
MNNNQIYPNRDQNRLVLCPYCEWIIPNQLIDKLLINENPSIICEQCGNELKKDYFNLTELRKYRKGETIDYKKLLKKKGKKLYSSLKSKFNKLIEKNKKK